MTTGSAVSVAAAISGPQSVPRSVVNEASQTVKGLLLRAVEQDVGHDVLVPGLDEGEDRRRDEAGATSGSRMRTNAPKRVEPSTIAASSSSCGTPSMKPRSVQTQNGSTNVRYVTITPRELVHLVGAAEQDVERDDQRVQRHHLDADDQDDERAPPVEAELRERERGEEREHERERGHARRRRSGCS